MLFSHFSSIVMLFRIFILLSITSLFSSTLQAQLTFAQADQSVITAVEIMPGADLVTVLAGGSIAYTTTAQAQTLDWQQFPQANNTSAALAVSASELLLFRGSTYRSLNIQTGVLGQTEEQWFGLPQSWGNSTSAATSWDANSAILFNGLEYIIYDFNSQQNISAGRVDEWPGYSFQGPNVVNAALALGRGQIQLITQRGSIIYDQSAQQFLSNSPARIAAPTYSPSPSSLQPVAQNQSYFTNISGSDSGSRNELDWGAKGALKAITIYTTQVWGDLVVAGIETEGESGSFGLIGKTTTTKRRLQLQSGEVLTGFSGSYGHAEEQTIDQLAFKTNRRTLPIIGNRNPREGTSFAERLSGKETCIGLFGTASDNLSGIGLIYTGPERTLQVASSTPAAITNRGSKPHVATGGNTFSTDEVMAVMDGTAPSRDEQSIPDENVGYVPVDEYLDNYDDFTEKSSGNMTEFMVQPLSGIDWLGAGFDVLYYDPLRPNDLRPRKSFRSVLVTSSSKRAGNNNQYLKPYGSFFGSSNSGERSEESKWVHNYRDFSSSFGVTASGTVPMKGVMGSLSGSYKEMNNTRIGSESLFMFKEIQRRIHEVELQLTWIDNDFDQKYKQKLDRQFVRDVKALPVPSKIYSGTEVSAKGQPLPSELERIRGNYRRFINNYGTHIASKVVYGGQYIERYEVRRSDYEKTRGTEMSFKASVEMAAKKGGKGGGAGGGDDGGKKPGGEVGFTKSESETIGAKALNTRRKVFIQGGNGEDDLSLWRGKVDQNMAPVHIEFMAMSEVLNERMFADDADILAKSKALEVITAHYMLNEAPEPVEGKDDFFRDLPPLEGPAVITVKNKGGYVMWYTVKYQHKGEWHEEESGNFPVAQSKDIRLPGGATNITIHAEQTTGEIFSEKLDKLEDTCYECWGTIFSTAWGKCD
jgi:hypothetical protein